jgi:hypothetical protein
LLREEWLSPAELAEREELRMRRIARRRLTRGEIDEVKRHPVTPVLPILVPQVAVNLIPPTQPTPLQVDGNDGDSITRNNDDTNTQGVIEIMPE